MMAARTKAATAHTKRTKNTFHRPAGTAHPKLSDASARFSDQIKVSPEVARYAAEQGENPTTGPEGTDVSGNGKQFIWTGNLITPTEDPEGVVHEVVNEITGRL
jgi:hypothetical protein